MATSDASLATLRFKHRVVEKPRHGTEPRVLGDAYSLNGSEDVKIASQIVISTVVIESFDEHLSTASKTFSLVVKADRKESKQLVEFVDFLAKNPDRVAILTIDKLGTKVYARAFTALDGWKTGFTCGLYCCFSTSSTAVTPVASSSSSITQHYHQPTVPIATANVLHVKEVSEWSPYDAPSSSLGKRSVDESATLSASANTFVDKSAESHYNQLKRNRNDRHLSHIYHLRNLDNFLKARLLQLAATHVPAGKPISVLDLACGKGGDYYKWTRLPQVLERYVGVDIALESLRDFAVERIGSDPNHTKRVHKLICADLSRHRLARPSDTLKTFTWLHGAWQEAEENGPLPSSFPSFDLVSCQFAMHYMFHSKPGVDNFFAEISQRLSNHGRFVATTVDSRVLAMHLRNALYGPASTPASITPSTSTDSHDIAGKGKKEMITVAHDEAKKEVKVSFNNDLGHELLTIKMSTFAVNRLLSLPVDTPAAAANDGHDDINDGFGLEYTFTLRDQQEDGEAAVDAPEWIVPLNHNLLDMFRRHKLRVIRLQNFHEFYLEQSTDQQAMQLMQDMHVVAAPGITEHGLSDAEWAIARLYLVLVCEKVNEEQRNDDQVFQPRPPGARTPTGPSPASPNAERIVKMWYTNIGHREPDSDPPRFSPSSPKGPPPPSAKPSEEAKQRAMKMRWIPQPPTTLPSSVRFLQERNGDGTMVDEQEDPELMKAMALRARAVELAGGEDVWDTLTEDKMDSFLEQARNE